MGPGAPDSTFTSACGEGLYGAERSARRREEERYLAAFEQALQLLSWTVSQAAGREGSWLERVRAGVVALLGFFDDQPRWRRVLVVQAPPTGALARERERRVLNVLRELLEEGRKAKLANDRTALPPGLLAELVLGGIFSAIRTHILEGDDAGPLVELAPSLMAFIALPYLGQAAASAELAGMSAPAGETPPDAAGSHDTEPPAERLPMRATHRTMLVLRAIEAAPGSSNRQIAEVAGLSDEGQASKLLSRLSERGVIENVGVGAAGGEPNAWLLTADGRRVLRLTGGVPSVGSPRSPSGERMGVQINRVKE